MIKYLDTYRRAELGEATLDPDFIAQILKFPKSGRHALVNAQFSAVCLEQDRRDTRKEEIRRLIAGYEADVQLTNMAIAKLREDLVRLEKMR